ncbi:MAG: peptidylprolyl isomerase [Marinicellaceae bacterium]
MNKFFIHLFLLIFVVACNSPKKHFADVNVNSVEFKNWLKHNHLMQYYDKSDQIDSFTVEQFLFKKRELLNQKDLKKRHFLINAQKFSDSQNYIKKSIKSSIYLDEDKIKEQILVLNKIEDNKKDKIRLYQIYKNYPVNASQADINATINQLNEIKSNIHTLDDFKQMATLYSDSQSRLQKGLIGNIPKGKFPDSLDKVVMQLQENQMTDVLKGKKGAVLFFCEKVIVATKSTPEQIKQRVINRLKNHTLEKKYYDLVQKTLNLGHIEIDWRLMKEGDLKDISVNSTYTKISNQQLKWLLNGLNKNHKLNSFNINKIQNTIENYVKNIAFFNQLSQNSQQNLNLKFDFKYKNIIASEVMALMINEKLDRPTLVEERNYYQQNQSQFVRDKYYDISAIALKFDKDNKIEVYSKGQKILSQINNKSLSFKQAVYNYSFFKDNYHNGHMGNLSSKKIPNLIGINALKQIQLMQTGEISQLVETDSEILWVFRLNAIEHPRLMTFEEAQKKIHNILGNIQTKFLESNIIEEILLQIKKP